MANAEQLEILKQGVEVWNKWRRVNRSIKVDLSSANFKNANLKYADLRDASLALAELEGAELNFCNLQRTNFTEANTCRASFQNAQARFANFNKAICLDTVFANAELYFSNFSDSNCNGANFNGASLSGADFTQAMLQKAYFPSTTLRQTKFMSSDLTGADLSDTICHLTNFTRANLSNARLRRASFTETNVEQAVLTGCNIYGMSVWDLIGSPKNQTSLIITPEGQSEITVDELEMAQFIYLLLNNKNVRNAIDRITSKVVLILGRFTYERKAVLDAIRDKLRLMNLTPIIFDFEKLISKDLTGTVTTLANMARFIIADLTDPNSVPHELASISKIYELHQC